MTGGRAVESGRAENDGEKLASGNFVVDGENARNTRVIGRDIGEDAFGI